jgi:Pregnancy-associated plasma protein-A
MRRVILAAALAAGCTVGAASAATTINLRVSVKVILNPANGARPTTTQGVPLTDQLIERMFQTANDSLLAPMWRGYRFQVLPVVEIGGPCTGRCSGPSAWFSQVFAGPTTDSLMFELENQAQNDPAFAWDATAINVYVNNVGNGAVSSFPFVPPSVDRANEVIVCGAKVIDDTFRRAFAGALIHHEIGHYFNLRHTNNNQPDCDDSTNTDCSACAGADDDSVTDTIEDRSCAAPCVGCAPGWQRDDIARHNFGLVYAMLSAGQRELVDDIYENNMSYHNGGLGYGHYILYRLTEGQLDYWADTANNIRHSVAAARTRFTSYCLACVGNGSSQIPYGSVWQAHYYANPGDILLLRPGHYPEAALILNKPVTLRATRTGPAVIGN